MILLRTIVVASFVLSLVGARNIYNDVPKFDFEIHRGDSKRGMARGEKARMVKRDGSVSVEISNERTYYLMRLEVGSNRDENRVVIDTGSSDLWVMSSDIDCESSSGSSGPSGGQNKRRMEEDLVVRLDDGGEVHELDASKAKRDSADPIARPAGGENTVYETIETMIPTRTAGGSDSTGSSGGSGGSGGSGSNSCVQYGSFNSGDSDSFSRNSSAPAFRIEYADGTAARGQWGHDDVRVGNTTVNDLSFGVVDVTSSNMGVLGVGLPGLEMTYSSSDGSNGYQYENLPLKLRNQGSINKSLYSLYLGDVNSDSGTILFGAVDRAKYSGELTTVPIVNTMGSYYSSPPRLQIVLSSISLNSSSDGTYVTEDSHAILLDSGSTLSYFTSALLRRFGETLGGEYSSSANAYIVDCVDDDSIRVVFNFSGKNIEVPLRNLLVQYGSNQCYLGIFESDSMLLGDNFLRSTYAVFDLEDYEISLAQARYTDDEDIRVVSSSVPGAVNAQLYSSTSVQSSDSDSSATSYFDRLSGAPPSIPRTYIISVPLVTVLVIFSSIFFL